MDRICEMVTVVLLMSLLTGCGNTAKDYQENTLIINRNDSILEVAVEDFQDSQVKQEELEAYIKGQIDAYNEKNGKKIRMRSIDAEDLSQVRLVLSYEDMDSYNGFNEQDCALEEYANVETGSLKGTYTSPDGTQVNMDELTEVQNARVLMVEAAIDIVVKGEILCFNEEISVKDQIATSTGNGTAVIIFK
ncbi:MAG: hypothetical protein IJ801_03020 [Lachnospiraceae bacterium]|nr:hypothetical protein [Lachnospiraceae bacterium]